MPQGIFRRLPPPFEGIKSAVIQTGTSNKNATAADSLATLTEAVVRSAGSFGRTAADSLASITDGVVGAKPGSIGIESFIGITPGSVSKDHSWSRVINATTVDEPAAQLAEPLFWTYGFQFLGLNLATANEVIAEVLMQGLGMGNVLSWRLQAASMIVVTPPVAAALASIEIGLNLAQKGVSGVGAAWTAPYQTSNDWPLTFYTVQQTGSLFSAAYDGPSRVIRVPSGTSSPLAGPPSWPMQPRAKPLLSGAYASAVSVLTIRNLTAIATMTVDLQLDFVMQRDYYGG